MLEIVGELVVNFKAMICKINKNVYFLGFRGFKLFMGSLKLFIRGPGMYFGPS